MISALIKLWTVLCFLLTLAGCAPSHSKPPLLSKPKPSAEASLFAGYETADGAAYCEYFNAVLIGGGYNTGVLSLPMDPALSGAPQVHVFYYHKPFRAGASPVIFFNGGPTYSSHSSRDDIKRTQEKRREWSRTLDFVFMDQRGTGCSSAYPYLGTAEGLLSQWSKFGSRHIVLDAEAIRKKLIGDKKWKVFGQSFGAQVVYRYVAEFPQALISAHAHGGAIGQEGFQGFVLRIASQQRVVKEYLKRYPQDAEDLGAAVRLLDVKTCFDKSDGSQKFCGRSLIHSLIFSLGFSDQWSTLHEWITDLVDEGKLNSQAVQDLVDSLSVFRPPNSVANQAMTSINWLEYQDENLDYVFCQKVLDELRHRGEAPEEWLLHECAGTLQYPASAVPTEFEKARKTSIAADPVTLSSVAKSLALHPALQFYVYSGEFDTFVPREVFAEEIKQIGHAIRYYHFSGSGHEGYLNESRVWRDLIRTPSSP